MLNALRRYLRRLVRQWRLRQRFRTPSSRRAQMVTAANRPGYYFWHGQRHARSEIIVVSAPTAVSEVFLDLMRELGEEIVLVLGEPMPAPQPLHLLSFSQPAHVAQMESVLSAFADVLNLNQGLEVSVQNTRKCCHLVLSCNKHMFLDVCEPARYLRALESRGLRQSDDLHATAVVPWRRPCFLPSPADEMRLQELKLQLALRSSFFPPLQDLVH